MRSFFQILLLALASCASIPAAPTNLVTIACTNVLGKPDTNVVKVFPISTPINADGTYFVTGTPFRLTPNTNGICLVTNLMPGGYAATNQGLGSIVFAIPNAPGSYNAAQPGIALSGANKYNYTPGAIQIVPGAGISVSPANGIGVVTITSDLSGSGNILPNTALGTDSGGRAVSYAAGTGIDISGGVISATGGGGSQVWTNDVTFIWPSGEPAPDPSGVLAGPAFFLRSDGSQFLGTNVALNASILNLGRPYLAYGFSQMDSNQPQSFELYAEVVDNYDNELTDSLFHLQAYGNKDQPVSSLELSAYGTNNANWDVSLRAQPNVGANPFEVFTNGSSIYKVNGSGLVSAKGYTDSSLTSSRVVMSDASSPPRLVSASGGFTGDLKVVTNGTDTATYHFTSGVLTSVSAP